MGSPQSDETFSHLCNVTFFSDFSISSLSLLFCCLTMMYLDAIFIVFILFQFSELLPRTKVPSGLGSCLLISLLHSFYLEKSLALVVWGSERWTFLMSYSYRVVGVRILKHFSLLACLCFLLHLRQADLTLCFSYYSMCLLYSWHSPSGSLSHSLP